VNQITLRHVFLASAAPTRLRRPLAATAEIVANIDPCGAEESRTPIAAFCRYAARPGRDAAADDGGGSVSARGQGDGERVRRSRRGPVALVHNFPTRNPTPTVLMFALGGTAEIEQPPSQLRTDVNVESPGGISPPGVWTDAMYRLRIWLEHLIQVSNIAQIPAATGSKVHNKVLYCHFLSKFAEKVMLQTNLPLRILFVEVLSKDWAGPTVVPPKPY